MVTHSMNVLNASELTVHLKRVKMVNCVLCIFFTYTVDRKK